ATGSLPSKVRLDGLTYKHLKPVEVSQTNDRDHWIEWFLGEIRGGAQTPQPYHQFASFLTGAGVADQAPKVSYEGREKERATSSGLRWAWLTVLKGTIGYGYEPQRLVYWIVSLIAGGMILLRLGGEAKRNDLGNGFFYTVDMLLPLVHLREE